MSPFIDRIRRLARLRNEVWQAQIIRPPQWFADDTGKPRRPLMGVCVSTVSARLNTSNPHPPTDSPAEIILETLAAEGGAKALSGYRPQTLQVNDQALADELRAELVGRNVLPGRWTFQVVEAYDEEYYRVFEAAEKRVRDELMAGRRHVYEARLKEENRTHGRPGHEPAP